jgi:hypothetical protein
MLAHIPVLAKKFDIPLLLLPGPSSIELGKTLDIRRTSIIMFLSPKRSRSNAAAEEGHKTTTASQCQSQADGGRGDDRDEQGIHAKIDSFVDYIIKQIIPTG